MAHLTLRGPISRNCDMYVHLLYDTRPLVCGQGRQQGYAPGLYPGSEVAHYIYYPTIVPPNTHVLCLYCVVLGKTDVT